MLTLSAKWKRLTEVRERLRQIDSEQAALESAADRYNGGAFTDAQRSRYDALTAEWRERKAEQGRLEDELKHTKPPHLPRRTRPEHAGAPGPMTPTTQQTTEWRDTEGRPVRLIAPHEPYAARSETSDGEPVSIGRMLRALALGDWRDAPAERAMMSGIGGAHSGFHNAIPEELSGQLIDLARARSVLIDGGAQTVEMRSDALRIIRVEEDPTFMLKSEGAAFTPSSMKIGSIAFHAKTVGTLLQFSREELADAPNAASVIEDVLGRSLGVEIDRLGLLGSGSAEPVGILHRPGIGATASVGTPNWDDLIDALADIEGNNHMAGSYILHPDVKAYLAKLKDSQGRYLDPPEAVRGLRRLETTAMPTDSILVGDFSRVLLAIRQAAQVETTSTSDDTFERHTVKFKVTYRFDVGVTYSGAFHALTGVTLS